MLSFVDLVLDIYSAIDIFVMYLFWLACGLVTIPYTLVA